MGQAAWVDVANAAIIKVGTQLIVSLNSGSVAAKLCKARLPLTVPLVLRRFPWKSAMTTQSLSALASPPLDPNWRFAYQLPTDIVRVWKLSGIPIGNTFVIRKNQMWANLGITASDGTTVGETPLLTYVADPYLVGPGALDPLLLEAIACQLAVEICYQLTESLPLKQSLQGDYKVALQTAKSVDSMETQEVFDWEASEFLTSRFAGTGFAGPNVPGMAPAQ